jgi:hypothetical protein
MGKSSGQVTGYRYYANFLLFIGNPIEKLMSINFDKRGWVPYNQFSTESMLNIDEAYMYGENEGGVFGDIDIYKGTSNQQPNETYKQYMESIGLKASGFPYQSYLVFRGGPAARWTPIYGQPFYLGNSGYMKEMLLWPKRTRIRNDGRRQWYEMRGDGAVVCEIGVYYVVSDDEKLSTQDVPFHQEWFVKTSNEIRSSGELDGIWVLSSELSPYSEVGIAGDIGEGGDADVSVKFTLNGYGVASVEFFYTHLKDAVPNLSLIGLFNVKKIIFDDTPENITITYRITADFLISKGFELLASASANADYDVTIIYDDIRIFNPRISSFIKNDELDINPIHKIREILTDDTAMNKPESSVNNDNFIKAADRIWDEGLGISWSITEKSCIDAINELCYHIEAGIRVNRQTGLYEMVLFRDNWFEEDEIHTISESKIKSMQYEITNADEVINQVNVNFYDRGNIKNSSFSISESGLIQTLGRVNAETVDFPYFMNMRNAEIVANLKLKLLSTGVYKGNFTTGWREARKWNRYDLIRLPWSKRWTGAILVRIMSINLGGPTNNEVSIEFVEVVPSTGMLNTTIVADDVIDKPLPPQACQYEPFEMPYYLAVMALGQRKADEELAYDSNFGLVGVVAEKPQENSLYAVMMTNNYDEWVRAGSIQYSLTADLDQIISKTSSSFTVKNWRKIANVAAGTLIKCGRDWLGTPGEWMVLQGVDPYTGIVSVKRGALDTPPQEWGIDTKLYFCGNDVAYDQTEYVSGEEVLVSALTTTPSGVLEQKGSNAIEMKARAIRPYPPANVKINDAYWPKEIETDLVLTWVDRNRLQQTGGEIIGWFDSGVTIESGVTYQLTLVELNNNRVVLRTQNINLGASNIYTFLIADMDEATRSIEITLKSIRDEYDCLEHYFHTVDIIKFFSKPYNITAVVSNI